MRFNDLLKTNRFADRPVYVVGRFSLLSEGCDEPRRGMK